MNRNDLFSSATIKLISDRYNANNIIDTIDKVVEAIITDCNHIAQNIAQTKGWYSKTFYFKPHIFKANLYKLDTFTEYFTHLTESDLNKISTILKSLGYNIRFYDYPSKVFKLNIFELRVDWR